MVLLVLLLALVFTAILATYYYFSTIPYTYLQNRIYVMKLDEKVNNILSVLLSAVEPTTGKTYSFLISYFISTGNEIFCIEKNKCVNITKALTNFLNRIAGNRWRLELYVRPAALKGWPIKMFVITGNVGCWDVCAFNPPKDNNGKNWWEYDYNDSFFVKNWEAEVFACSKTRKIRGAGWVLVSAPFHEYPSPPGYGLSNLYKGGSNPNAVKQGICIPIYKILPKYTKTNASVYCPKTEWDLFNSFAVPSDDLPKDYDFGKYYSAPPVYKTATDITVLAKELGIISNYNTVVGSFYRGNVTIPKECREVYLEAPWHEVIRLYIAYINKTGQPDYVWLIASPQCTSYSTDPNGKKGPIIKNRGSQDIVRFNITKWVILNRSPKNNIIVIANAYWDPHPGSNGVSMVRVYCITKDGKKLELNENFEILGSSSKKIILGHTIPTGIQVIREEVWLPINHDIIKTWYFYLYIW